MLKKSFWVTAKFSRTAAAFHVWRRGGPHRFTKKLPWTFLSALRSFPALGTSKNQPSRNFRGRQFSTATQSASSGSRRALAARYSRAESQRNGPSTGGHAETVISSDARGAAHPVALSQATPETFVPSKAARVPELGQRDPPRVVCILLAIVLPMWANSILEAAFDVPCAGENEGRGRPDLDVCSR
jgi:hypothetical protein